MTEKVKMNWLDNVVGFFSPEAGNRRFRARKIAAFARAYEGASVGRRTDGWTTGGQDANAEIKPGVRKLRERSRDMIRNNAYAARIMNVIVANTVGHGIVGNFLMYRNEELSATIDSKKQRRLWKQFSETPTCDFGGQLSLAGLQTQGMMTIAQSGGVLVKRVRVKPTPESPIPFKIQVLEPDYIDIDKEGNDVIQGVQFDPAGKMKGLWLFDQHPGADTNTGKNESKLVPISEVRYCFRPDRPGQLHGVPWLAPVMTFLKDLDDMIDATLYKQKISAAFVAFVHDMEAFNDATGNTKKGPALGEKMEPGMIEVLPPGKDIKFATPPSATDFPSFTQTILKAVCSGVNVPYEAAVNLQGVSFSAGRMGSIEFNRSIDQWRWNMFIPQFNGIIEQWWAEAMIMTGNASAENVMVWTWTPPRREQIDPVAETNAAINAVRGGIKSLRQVHEEIGEDHIEVLDQIAATNKLLDEKGIIVDTDPRRIMKAGIVQSGIDAAAVGTLDQTPNPTVPTETEVTT